MAALPSDRVYQGFWIDYSQGQVLGATITTTTGTANLVIAILSLLVGFTGAHLWDLIAFISYFAGVSNRLRPAFYHQRQFLARNLTSPGAFVLEMAKVGWAWRRQRPWSSLTLMTLFALVCSAGFLAAGIFVSLVVSNSGIRVLAQSASCGFLSWRNESSNLHRQYQQLVLNQAVIYSESCYNKTGSRPQCNIYSQPSIPIQSAADAECPFSGLCTNHTALSLDTGLLDSDAMFGINAPADLRVQMQRVVTCAPLDHVRFFTTRPYPPDAVRKYESREPVPGELIYEWSMGPLTASRRSFNSTIWMSNYTSAFSKNYDLTPRAYYTPATLEDPSQRWHNSTFTPLPGFRKDFADTHILAVQNDGVLFYLPNEDPLFSAHEARVVNFDNNIPQTMYTGDSPATFLGCTEQFKICFTQGNCTALLGVDQAYYQARKIAPTREQNATLRYLFYLTPTWYSLTSAPMQVTKNAVSFQSGVPPYQWKVEMFSWMNFLLAVAQSSITHLAAGPGIVGADFDQLAEPLEWPGLCHNQRMGSPDGYSNINVVGLAVIIAVSTTVIITNLTLVPALKYLNHCNPRIFPRIQSWREDGLLQVQRKAFDGAGYSSWSSTNNSDVPVIRSNSPIPALSAGITRTDIEAAVPGPRDTKKATEHLHDNHRRRSYFHPRSFSRFHNEGSSTAIIVLHCDSSVNRSLVPDATYIRSSVDVCRPLGQCKYRWHNGQIPPQVWS